MRVYPIMANAWNTAGRMDEVGPFVSFAWTENGYEMSRKLRQACFLETR